MPKFAAEFIEVSKTYPRRGLAGRALPALREVSLAIEEGETFALLGPNRAGKTTLLKILLGLCRPTRGEVRRLGLPTSRGETLARVGFMHEMQAFPPYHSATSLLGMLGVASGMDLSKLSARRAEVLARVGLSERAHEPIRCYSKGMVQRLALAQALLASPDLLVLDEPLEGLDLLARGLLHEVIREQRAEGKTTLIVSHELGEIAESCDRLAVLVEGRVVLTSRLPDLMSPTVAGAPASLGASLRPYYAVQETIG